MAMGKGIIQLIMAEYAKDQDGRWHELLFEIVNGRPSGAEFYSQTKLWKFWAGWLEGGRRGREV